MYLTAQNIYRVLNVTLTLARHDALFPLKRVSLASSIIASIRFLVRKQTHGRPGERLARAFQQLGPSFIKLGQALSTRPDIIGSEVASDLSKLQDDLPPFPTPEARNVIEIEFGTKLEVLFSEFDEVPLAAASIAQVHLAITIEGKPVAVKILRPGVEKAFQKDLDLLLWVAKLIEYSHTDIRRLKPVEVIRTFQETTRMEMDLRLEAAAAEEIKQNFHNDPDFEVPSIDWQRTSKRVMTLDRIQGIPIDERELLIKNGFDPKEVLSRAAGALFKQVFRDGFFHADQHPGNLFVGENGQIIAIDFGIMGRLDKPTRQFLGEMLLSFLNRDYSRVAEIHFEAGYVRSYKSVHAFSQACRAIAEPILDKPQHEISIAGLLAQLFQVAKTFEMETQPQLLLLQKTMLVAEGVGRKLSPEINLWFLAQPLIEEWFAENMGTETIIMNKLEEASEGLRKIPRLLSEIEKRALGSAENGLRLHPDTSRGIGISSNHTNKSNIRLYTFIIIILIAILALA